MDIKNIGANGTRVVLDKTSKATSVVVLFLPGVSGGAFSQKYDCLSQTCRENNIDFLRVQGWNSPQDLQEKTMDQLHESIHVAVAYLQEDGYTTVMAIGKSMGGTLLLTCNHPAISRLVLWAPVLGFVETNSNLSEKTQVRLADVHSLLEVTADKNILSQITAPVRIIQGARDQVMPLACARRLAESLPSADLIEVEEMGHSYDTPDQERHVLKATVDFLAQ